MAFPDPYPRRSYADSCPWDLKLSELRAIPIAERVLTHHGMGIESIYAILGCDPANGRADVETVIAELLASGGGAGQGFMPHHIISAETITVPTRRQMIVHDGLLVEGSLVLEGTAELVVL